MLKWSRYRPGVAQRVVRGIALLFHDRGTRRGWVVSSTPRPHFTTGKTPVPILQEAGWAPGPVWTGGKSRPHRDSIPHRPARSQSLYWVSYRAHSYRQSIAQKYCYKRVRLCIEIRLTSTLRLFVVGHVLKTGKMSSLDTINCDKPWQLPLLCGLLIHVLKVTIIGFEYWV